MTTSDRVRVLIVAAPFISQGGVYTSLQRTIPRLQGEGLEVGVVWGSRAPGGDLPGDFVVRLGEPSHPLRRGRALRAGIERAVDEFRPDVLLSVLPQSDVACAHVHRRRGVPWIAMIRGRPYPTGPQASLLKQVAWRLAVRRAYNASTLTIAISRGLAAETERALRVSVDRILYNGVDIDAFPVREADPRRPLRIGFVGQLVEGKAPGLVAELADRLDREVAIIGDGPLRADLDELARADPRISMKGWLSPREAMSSLDILIVPSLHEGLGNVVLEAGASRVAVVARTVGGIPEIIGSDTRLRELSLVPTTAGAHEFARAVERLVGNPTEIEEAADRLHDAVHARFSVEQAAGNHPTTLREVAGR